MTTEPYRSVITRYVVLPTLLVFALGCGAGWRLHQQPTVMPEQLDAQAQVVRIKTDVPKFVLCMVPDGIPGGFKGVDCATRHEIGQLFWLDGKLYNPNNVVWRDELEHRFDDDASMPAAGPFGTPQAPHDVAPADADECEQYRARTTKWSGHQAVVKSFGCLKLGADKSKDTGAAVKPDGRIAWPTEAK